MEMEMIKHIKSILVSEIHDQLGHLDVIDAKELGEVVDMVKDLAETEYYCTVTEAMEGKGKYGYDDSMYHNTNYLNSGKVYREEEYYPYDMKDSYEGHSHIGRKTYMETKEMHHDKDKQMKALEHYLHELSEDVMEMIEDATTEEKQLLQKKLQTLATAVI